MACDYILCLVFLLAMTGPSSAAYCICKDGLGEKAYQVDIDYACGAGADCTPIQQNGACYNPNTLKDHCNYAVNSYFQKKGQAIGSCDFSGSAISTQALPSQQNSACVYPSSASPGGTGTTPTTPVTTPTTPVTTPTTPTPGTTTPTTPTTGTVSPSPPSTVGTAPPTTGTTTPTTGTITGTPPSSVFGLGPTSITPSTDEAYSNLPSFWALTLTLLFSGPLFFLGF